MNFFEKLSFHNKKIAFSFPDNEMTYSELLTEMEDVQQYMTDMKPGETVAVYGNYNRKSMAILMSCLKKKNLF